MTRAAMGSRLTVLALLLALAPGPARAQERPALVVMITVDQLIPEYLDRFGADLTGGFARLAREGTFFTRGMQDHAMTSTAPGHATLWSGRFPARTGIVSNDLGVPDPDAPLVDGAAGAGASPRRFQGTALYDWVAAAHPDARILSVSRKDRGAILPVGRARAPVYWWSASGRFTTSRYYADALPDWVRRWNEGVRPGEWTDRVWSPLLPESAYPEPDDGAFEPAFPHRVASVADLADVPWMDSLTLDLALTGARELELGRRGVPDLLAVGLSTLDAIGHEYGPDSREVHDHFVRLDRWLGAFLSALEADVGRGRVLVVLSSDHGVSSLPAVLRARGAAGGRLDLGGVLLSLPDLDPTTTAGAGLRMQDGLLLADTAALRARGIDVERLGARLAALAGGLDGVARAWTPATIGAAATDDQAAGRWRRSIPPSYGWLVAVDPKSGWTFETDATAHHGTSMDENVRVPVFFLGAGIPARRIDREVRTVDVAPTIAALLGLRPTEPVDGRPLAEVLPGS